MFGIDLATISLVLECVQEPARKFSLICAWKTNICLLGTVGQSGAIGEVPENAFLALFLVTPHSDRVFGCAQPLTV